MIINLTNGWAIMRNLLFAFCFITLFYPAVSMAAGGTPVPAKKEGLGELRKNLEKETRQKDKLQEQMEYIEDQLGKTKKSLVKISSSIQKNEETLGSLEKRISDLEQEQSEIQKNLNNDRQSISRLILALQRVRRVPPEALIAKPGEPLKAAQSAMLMQDIIPALNRQAETLKTNLEELEKVTSDLKSKKEKALMASAELNREYAELSGLVEQRERLYASTNKDFEEQQRYINIISKRAKNLQDLVQKIEDNKKREKERTETSANFVPTSYERIPDIGKPQLPISGIIRTSYSQKDAFGAPSQGLSIEGRGGALVVAPMGGIIRFAGHFKNYGNMVIIEHEKGYHSLIAGLEKIDTVVGHSVSSGEPLGKLHFATDGQEPALYYELRLNGKAINPAKKISGLG